MALWGRVYFNAVFGALGGLIGWMLYAVFDSPSLADGARWLQGGALVGGGIGYFVVGVEAIRDLSPVRFCRLACYGAALGAAGGALGLYLAEQVNRFFVEQIGPPQSWGGLEVLGFAAARGLSLMTVGLAVGLSEGIAARSLGKVSYGAAGGAVGGFVGGALFAFAYYHLVMKGADAAAGGPAAAAWGALGLVILGACIGMLSALVQGVFQAASVRVLRGWQEGREYPLDKADNLLGRDEHADIALFRDPRVEKRHAFIRRRANRCVLVNNGAPPEQTRVNGEPVPQRRDLQDGDRIQLGNVVLRFQLRAATPRQKPLGREPRASAAALRSPEARG